MENSLNAQYQGPDKGSIVYTKPRAEGRGVDSSKFKRRMNGCQESKQSLRYPGLPMRIGFDEGPVIS